MCIWAVRLNICCKIWKLVVNSDFELWTDAFQLPNCQPDDYKTKKEEVQYKIRWGSHGFGAFMLWSHAWLLIAMIYVSAFLFVHEWFAASIDYGQSLFHAHKVVHSFLCPNYYLRVEKNLPFKFSSQVKAFKLIRILWKVVIWNEAIIKAVQNLIKLDLA